MKSKHAPRHSLRSRFPGQTSSVHPVDLRQCPSMSNLIRVRVLQRSIDSGSSDDIIDRGPIRVVKPVMRRHSSLELYLAQAANSHVSNPLPDRSAEVKSRPQRLVDRHVESTNSTLNNNAAMASQLHDLRRQLSVQKMTTTVNLCIRRKLVVAMSRWKQSVKQAAEQPTVAPPQSVNAESTPDPFMMEAIYMLAWQRRQDRRRAMALALRKVVLPMMHCLHLRTAMSQWRQAAEKTTPVKTVILPTAVSSKRSQGIVPPATVSMDPNIWTSFLPSQARSPISQISHSTLVPNSARSDMSITSYPSPPPPGPVNSRMNSSFIMHQDSALGETIGSPLQQSDSHMCYTIYHMMQQSENYVHVATPPVTKPRKSNRSAI